jgi:mannose-6-phosphate isomerase-like protein (cupin superfamily)
MTRAARPSRILADEITVMPETDAFHVGTIVSRDRHGSAFLLGTVHMEPGPNPVSWTAAPDVHETYTMQAGHLHVAWDGSPSGSAELHPTDSFYFPPGRTYTLRNVGPDPVALLYVVHPAPR